MHENATLRAKFIAHLPDGFQEGQAFNIAHRATDFDQHEIIAIGFGLDHFLDLVGDVRNHLHRPAQVISAPFRRNHIRIDAPRGPVIRLARMHAGEAFIMAKIKIGFRAIIGDENLPMLIGAHRPRIDIEVGVKLAQPNLVTARLQQRAERSGSDTLTK